MIALEEIRDASDAALAKIDRNPDRISELSDYDLCSVATHLKTMRPLIEQTLVAFCCGDVARADAALARVKGFSQEHLVRLVQDAHKGMRTHRNPTLHQLAAMVLDAQTGVGAVTVELERRQALRANALN